MGIEACKPERFDQGCPRKRMEEAAATPAKPSTVPRCALAFVGVLLIIGVCFVVTGPQAAAKQPGSAAVLDLECESDPPDGPDSGRTDCIRGGSVAKHVNNRRSRS